MMANPLNPDRLPWEELPEPLRSAVHHIRQERPPVHAMARALERARRTDALRARPWLRGWGRLVLPGAIAAALLVGVGLRIGSSVLGGRDPHARNGTAVPGSGGSTSPPTVAHTPVEALRPVGIRTRSPGDDSFLQLDAEGLRRLREWERAQDLRTLAAGMPSADRKALERYLRAQSRAGKPSSANVYLADSRALKLHSLHGSGHMTSDCFHVRTVLDLIYLNPGTTRLEGTFECPLPARATPLHVSVFVPAEADRPGVPRRFERRIRVELTDPKRATLAAPDLARLVNADDWERLLEARFPDPAPKKVPAAGDGTTFCAGPFPIAAGGA